MSKESVNYTKKERVLRDIYEYEPNDREDQSAFFSNKAGLSYFKKGIYQYISANELNDILKGTDYGISPIACYAPMSHPLFDKHGKMYDILLGLFTLDNFICDVENRREAYLDEHLEHINLE